MPGNSFWEHRDSSKTEDILLGQSNMVSSTEIKVRDIGGYQTVMGTSGSVVSSEESGNGRKGRFTISFTVFASRIPDSLYRDFTITDTERPRCFLLRPVLKRPDSFANTSDSVLMFCLTPESRRIRVEEMLSYCITIPRVGP